MPRKWSHKRLQTKLWDEHYAEGKRLYKKRFDSANVGWASSDYGICSKVYAIRKGQVCMILSTEIDDYGNVKHTNEPYLRSF